MCCLMCLVVGLSCWLLLPGYSFIRLWMLLMENRLEGLDLLLLWVLFLTMDVMQLLPICLYFCLLKFWVKKGIISLG